MQAAVVGITGSRGRTYLDCTTNPSRIMPNVIMHGKMTNTSTST